MTPTDRLRICRACPEYQSRGLLSTCRVCGCFLAAKTKLKSQVCPQGRWDAVQTWTKEPHE